MRANFSSIILFNKKPLLPRKVDSVISHVTSRRFSRHFSFSRGIHSSVCADECGNSWLNKSEYLMHVRPFSCHDDRSPLRSSRLISAVSRVALLIWKVKVCRFFLFQASRGVHASALRRIPPCRFAVTASLGNSVWTRVVHPFQAPRGTTVASSASIVALSKVTLLEQRTPHDLARYRIEEYFRISSFRESNVNVAARTSWRNRHTVRIPSRNIEVYRCQGLIDLWVLIRTRCR